MIKLINLLVFIFNGMGIASGDIKQYHLNVIRWYMSVCYDNK